MVNSKGSQRNIPDEELYSVTGYLLSVWAAQVTTQELYTNYTKEQQK